MHRSAEKYRFFAGAFTGGIFNFCAGIEMASIFKTRFGTFEVQWRQGQKRKSKSFKTKREAREFASRIKSGDTDIASYVTLRSLIEEYVKTQTIKKRGVRSETLRLKKFATYPISQRIFSTLTKKDFRDFIEERLNDKNTRGGTLATSTVIRELSSVKAVIRYFIEQGCISSCPLSGVQMPKPPEARERIATEEEQEKIIVSAGWDGVSPPENLLQLTALAFIFSCRTGMRSGEILKLDIAWIDGNVIHLPKEATKTLTKRDVALGSDALRLLNLAISIKDKKSSKVFGALNDSRRDALFRKIRDRAGLGAVVDSDGNVIREGLNFHDARATFATWAASPDPKTGAPRLDVLALAKQTGHRNLKMLMRYYRAGADEIARRLG